LIEAIIIGEPNRPHPVRETVEVVAVRGSLCQQTGDLIRLE
jgi:hypothetical protein